MGRGRRGGVGWGCRLDTVTVPPSTVRTGRYPGVKREVCGHNTAVPVTKTAADPPLW